MPKCETECWANSAGITDIAISPDNSRVYVSELWTGDSFYAGTVTMIDTATNTVVGSTTPSQYGDFYSNIEVSPDGTRLYAGSGYPYYPQMDVLDARTLALVGTVRLDGNPGWPPVSMASLTFSPNGERAYARLTQIWPDYPSQTFAVIDTKPGSPTYNTQIATITVPSDAQYMKVSNDNKRGYVVHNGGKTVTVVDLTNNTVIGSISSSEVGGDYAALVVDDDGTLYFSNYPRNAVYSFEPGGLITM
jgi:DNA-binding beta-propeller fold protein YncE